MCFPAISPFLFYLFSFCFCLFPGDRSTFFEPSPLLFFSPVIPYTRLAWSLPSSPLVFSLDSFSFVVASKEGLQIAVGPPVRYRPLLLFANFEACCFSGTRSFLA